eukprot:15325287-Ditylum_brightwellii.AAC.1
MKELHVLPVVVVITQSSYGMQRTRLSWELQGHSSAVNSLVVFEHGGSTCLASGSSDSTTKLWNAEHQTLLGTLQGHSRSVMSLAVFEHEGATCLASGSEDKTIKL